MSIYAPPLSFFSATAGVTTAESTASTSYVQLTTTTDQVTVNVGPSGMVLASLFAESSSSSATGENLMGIDVSGATTIAVADAVSAFFTFTAASINTHMSKSYVISGLAIGSTTFKLKYRVVSGTGTFSNRVISVVPLG